MGIAGLMLVVRLKSHLNSCNCTCIQIDPIGLAQYFLALVPHDIASFAYFIIMAFPQTLARVSLLVAKGRRGMIDWHMERSCMVLTSTTLQSHIWSGRPRLVGQLTVA